MDGEPVARDRLLAEHAEATNRLAAIRAEFARLLDDTYLNTDDEHDIEGASMPFEREQARALLRQATARLGEADAALGRLEAGSYGTCETCGGLIDARRLDARPSARTCIRCATHLGRRR